ncbi:hypothetical protein ACOSQ2_019721 [Xanthoceras sorbifolium]
MTLWVSRSLTFKVPSRPVLDERLTVSQLKTELGNWNVPMLEHNCLPKDVVVIISLPLSLLWPSNSLLWHYDKWDMYSVKSAYKVALSSLTNPSGSGLCVMQSYWKFLWRITIPPNVKVFIWKVAYNWILSTVNLSSGGIKADDLCFLCKRGPNTTFHALWGCPNLKSVRSSSAEWSAFLVVLEVHILDFLVTSKDKLEVFEFKLLCVVLWRVWFRRNRAIHGLLLLPAGEIVDWSCAFLFHFQEA